MTLKNLKAARNNAERRAGEWWDKREAELAWYCVCLNGSMVPLVEVFQGYYYDHSVADAIETSGLNVYEEDFDDDDDKYKECTRRAIARLRLIEQKIKEWDNKYYYLDCAVDGWDEETGLSEGDKRDLAALGYAV